MLLLAEARARILRNTEPGETIEVSLAEAPGLVLAEPVFADVDSPPFDRAAIDGYAIRSRDAAAGGRLRVVGQSSTAVLDDLEVEAEEAARVTAGDPLPMGADAVIGTDETRPEPTSGTPRFVEVLSEVEFGGNVVRRGYYRRAGTVLAPAGVSVHTGLIGLLASQGCAYPVCHRRVRVAVLAVGDHLVGPGEAPVMDRERNAAGPTVVAPCLHHGATAHDLGTVAESDLDAALSRALTAPIVVVLGRTRGAIPYALARANVEPVFEGVALQPGKRVTYGVVRSDSGRVAHHVFHLPANPIDALTVTTLLVGPLITRLQGGGNASTRLLRAALGGPHRPTEERTWAVPVTLSTDDDARLNATPVEYRGKDDLGRFARADALALLSPRANPWYGGEVVEVAPLAPWPRSPL